MTLRTCAWCGRTFDAPTRPGPASTYCRPSHRQRAYEARRKAARAAASSLEGGSSTPEGAPHGTYIKVLGPVAVFDPTGNPIPMGPTSRAVLAALATRPRQVVSTETLIDEVWPGTEDRAARHRLHSAISKLRSLLASPEGREPQELIRWVDPGYMLSVSDDQLDWTRSRRLRIAGERALHNGDACLAKSYLETALGFWDGAEPLAGVAVSSDALSFVAERTAGREQASRNLIEARLLLRENVIPEAEAAVVCNPLDDFATAQLIRAFLRNGESARALETCGRYLRLADREGDGQVSRVADLQRSILMGDVDTEFLQHNEPPARDTSTAAYPGFLSARWGSSRTSLLPAELQLLIEDRGGRVLAPTAISADAAFADVGLAVRAAVALVRCEATVRVGIEWNPRDSELEVLDGPPRVRARMLAAAAFEGQILISGASDVQPTDLPPGTTLLALGSHRITTMGPAAPVHQLLSPDLQHVTAQPRWLDQAPVHNLVQEPFPLVDREHEIASVTHRLSSARLITFTGAPGSGKTRLGSRIASSVTRDYADGVWFVPLQPLPHAGLVIGSIAHGLRMPRPASVHEGALVRYLADRHLLLVLDNCEHVLAECRQVVDALLEGCPGLTILATSREALRSRHEQIVRVHPLDPPATGGSSELLDNHAVRLFLDRMDPDRAGPSLSDEEVQAVARICRALEGIPLALVVAAARASEIGPTSLAEILEASLGEGRGLKILAAGPRVAKLDRGTLTGTLEWSYGTLTRKERRLFSALSVFRSTFSVEDVSRVCTGEGLTQNDVIMGVERLAQKSLVESDAAARERRFRLLQPVRDFASSKLAARRSTTRVEVRHAEHFLTMLKDAEPRIRGPQDRATLDEIERRLPDIYAAIRWAPEAGRVDIALEMAGALWVFWLVRGRITEGRQVLESLLALETSPSRALIRAMVACAHLSWFGGDVQRSLEVNQRGVLLSREIGDEWGKAMGALGLAAVKMFEYEDHDVLVTLEKLLPRFYELGDAWDTCQLLQTIGGAAWHRGLYPQAEAAMGEAVALYRSAGHPTQMAALRVHGLMLALQGKPEEGAAELDHSIAITYEQGDLSGLSEALCCRAAVARYSGNHDLARRYYGDALRMARDGGNGWMLQWALDGIGDTEQLGLDAAADRYEDSVVILARAAAMTDETGIRLAPQERLDHARDLQRARARLGEERFLRASGRGWSLPIEEAIELALTLDSRPVPV